MNEKKPVMKKTFLLFPIALMFFISGCFKDTPAVDFSVTGNIVEILPPYGGAENFDNAALFFDVTEPADSVMIVVNLAAKKTLKAGLAVTLAIDDPQRTAYNAANGTDYEMLPDSVFSFPVTSGIIPAGKHLDTLMTYFFPDKLDTTKNYMLPVSLKDAGGQPLSGNFGTAFLHFDAR